LGSGGFGDVYEGEWKGQNYAIKVIKANHSFVPDPDTKINEPILSNYADQSIYESLITAYLKSQDCRVVRTHKAFKCSDGKSYIVMDKLLGTDLNDLINIQRTNYDIDHYFMLTYRMLCGLTCCHRNGIIHGDIKTENIFIERTEHPEGFEGTLGYNPIYIDFGLSCFDEENSKRFQAFVNENLDPSLLEHFRKTRKCSLRFGGGTPYYTAPEFLGIKGLRNDKSMPKMDRLKLQDSYSLGLTLYFMWIGGDPNHRVKNIQDYKKLIQEATLKGGPSMSLDYFHYDVPDEIVDIIAGLIETDYTQRITVEQALDTLKNGFLMAQVYELPDERCGSKFKYPYPTE